MTPDSRSARPRRRTGLGALARLWIARVLLALALVGLAGAASAAAYVGADTPDVKPEDWVKVATPQPVQLLFTFDTKGAPNGAATKQLKQQVLDTVKKSGLFSEVSDDASANGAVLNIVIDNVIDPQELQAAEAKGAVTGATLFIAGSNVTDHYVCTIDYLPNATAAKITRVAKHSVIIQLGLINSPPPNAVKIGSAKDAIYTMVREIIDNPLNAIAADPGFAGGPPTPSPAAATAPATQATAAPAQSTSPPPAPPATPAAPATPPSTTAGGTHP